MDSSVVKHGLVAVAFGFTSLFSPLSAAEPIPKHTKNQPTKTVKSKPTGVFLDEDEEAAKKNPKTLELIKKWDLPMDPKDYNKYKFKQNPNLKLLERSPWVIPSSTVAVPTGYGSDWGTIFAGIGFASRSRYTNLADSIIAMGFGLGDASKYVGLDTTFIIHDVKVFYNSAYSFSFKLHHLFPFGTAIAIGRENAIETNRPNDQGKSWYGAVSHTFALKDPSEMFSSLTLHAGAGDNVFQNEKSFLADKNEIGFFGGAGIRVFEPLSLIANWNQDLAIGVSVAPFHRFPLIINLSANDLTGAAGDGVRFLLNIGWGDSIFSDTFPFDFGQKKKTPGGLG